jgi:uncharacterized protein (DUF1501 family)
MGMNEQTAWTRREFIGNGLIMASAALTLPSFLQRSALALPSAASGSLAGVPEDRILVVLQLSGGNDGLNTVVPYGFDDYHKARPGIGIKPNEALKLDSGAPNGNGIGLHPGLAGMKDLYDAGLLSIIQGVGYPNPDRSHFRSMDIWHTADTNGTGDGWIGRYLDSECCGYGKGESGKPEKGRPDASKKAAARSDTTAPGIAIGRSAPLAMQGRSFKPVSFENTDLFRWIGNDIHQSLRQPYQDLNRRGDGGAEQAPDTNSSFLLRTALDAQVSSDLIRKAVATRPLVDFPANELGRQMAMVSSMIRAGLRTRVYYVSLGGFDTHAGQGGAQGRQFQLLQQVAQALKAFYADLKQQGNDGRVLTMTFSEFGRRVGQNASGGTDHGTAAPMFLAGPMVKAGLHGEHPSLTDLDQGDLKYRIDFRTVYAAILDDWMKVESKQVLDGAFAPARVLKKV